MSRITPIGSEAPAPAVEGEGLRIGGRCPNLGETCLILQACARQRPPSKSEVELIGRGRGFAASASGLDRDDRDALEDGQVRGRSPDRRRSRRRHGAGHARQARRSRGLERRRGQRSAARPLPDRQFALPPTDPARRHPDAPGKSAVTLHAPGGGATDAGDVLHLIPGQEPIFPAPALDGLLVPGRAHGLRPRTRRASVSRTDASTAASVAATFGSRGRQARSTVLSAELEAGSAIPDAADG